MSENIKLYIDQKEIEATVGSNLLQTAKDNGIVIPNLCYHKKLSPTGACRLCLVKIEGQNGMITSCSTEVKDGMKVIAFDQELEETRRNLLDQLLAEHNEHYDATYSDEFRDLILRYDLDKVENRNSESLVEVLDFHQDFSSRILNYDSSKCIKCYRCIKACDEVQGKKVLSMNERGINSYVVAGIGVWNAAWSGRNGPLWECACLDG